MSKRPGQMPDWYWVIVGVVVVGIIVIAVVFGMRAHYLRTTTPIIAEDTIGEELEDAYQDSEDSY